MKAISCFISLLLLCLLLTGCKKYEDGPWLSLRSKEHRVVGEWAVDYFSINGYDSTAYLKSEPLYGTYGFSKYESDNNGNFLYYGNGYGDVDTNLHYSSEGDWKFVDNKKSIQIICHSMFPGKHFQLGAFAADNVTWRIMRLEEKELWLKTTYTDGREYFVKFSLRVE